MNIPRRVCETEELPIVNWNARPFCASPSIHYQKPSHNPCSKTCTVFAYGAVPSFHSRLYHPKPQILSGLGFQTGVHPTLFFGIAHLGMHEAASICKRCLKFAIDECTHPDLQDFSRSAIDECTCPDLEELFSLQSLSGTLRSYYQTETSPLEESATI